jgi:hypothetical protein
VFSNRKWMRIALFLNLLGTVLLYLSFQATSSTVKIVRTTDGRTALCMGEIGVFANKGNVVEFGLGCPDPTNARPIAIVTVEKPALIYIGFALLTLGFLTQLLSVPSPKTLAQMRADVKAAEKTQKLAKRLASIKPEHPPKP